LGHVEELEAHEQPEHNAAEGLGQPRGVVRGPRHERAIGPEPAVRDEQMEVRMPVGAGALGLEAGDNADREIPLVGQGTNRRGDGARAHARDLAEQPTAIQTIRAEPLRDREDDLTVRDWCEE
jgi:hypothetical protein